jgi:hypothetical protein
VPGVSPFPAPAACRADNAAEQRLRSFLRSLLEQCAQLRTTAAQQSADAAAAAAAGAPGTHRDSSAAAGEEKGSSLLCSLAPVEHSGALAQQVIELVLQSLNDLRLTGFFGVEALLQACVDPIRAAVVATLPASQRNSSPAVLQTPDLQRLPRQLTCRLAAFCEAQICAFAMSPAHPPPPPVDLWDVQGDAETGFVQLSAAAQAGIGGQPPPAASPAWLFQSPLQLYPPWQARAAALHGVVASPHLAPSEAVAARRFTQLLREAAHLAEERTQVSLLAKTARANLEKLLKDFDGRPQVSRGPPQKGDMQGAAMALQREVLAWEDTLCAVRHSPSPAFPLLSPPISGDALALRRGRHARRAQGHRGAGAPEGRRRATHRRAARRRG